MSTRFGRDPRIIPVVLTGGPCGGKSTILAILKQWLENRGFKVAILLEAATEVITAGFSPNPAFWYRDTSFQKNLFRYILSREDRYYEMLGELDTEKTLILLCDRGALDAIAYMGRKEFKHIADQSSYSMLELLERYRAVIHLVTAANGAEHAYTLANNTARDESPELARELDKKTYDAWQGHQHHIIIDNSTDFEKKKLRTLQALARILHMPEPTEIERKWRITNFIPSMIPRGSLGIEIRQDYLESKAANVERRVRMRTSDGSSSFYYTEKRKTADPLVRGEIERQITHDEYEEKLSERDPVKSTVAKTRYTFEHGGHTIELDVYHGAALGLVIAEVELSNVTENPELPIAWEKEEVTADPNFKNAAIAKFIYDGNLRETLLAPHA
ncbi:MAG: AAA family ATPase [Patescibacteria group bacterium]